MIILLGLQFRPTALSWRFKPGRLEDPQDLLHIILHGPQRLKREKPQLASKTFSMSDIICEIKLLNIKILYNIL
jgi:hypothetical protein